MKKLKNIFEAFLVKILFAIIRNISMTNASNIFGNSARIIGPILPYSKIADSNLKLAMPELTEIKRKEIIKGVWENLGRVFGEFPHIHNISDIEFYEKVQVIGQEHIKNLEDSQAIFFSAHIANWEIAARVLNKLTKDNNRNLALIYRKANNNAIDNLILNERSRNNIKAIAKGLSGLKEISRHLKLGGNLAMLVDQKMNNGIEVPFFGKPAMTNQAIAKLSFTYNIPIIPVQIIREGKNNFIVKISSPIFIDKSEKNYIYNIMLKINLMIENWVKENPDQWFWVHRRWPKNKN